MVRTNKVREKKTKLNKIFVGDRYKNVLFSTDFRNYIQIDGQGYFDFYSSILDEDKNVINPDKFEIAFILDFLRNQFRTPQMLEEIIKFKTILLGENNSTQVCNPML